MPKDCQRPAFRNNFCEIVIVQLACAVTVLLLFQRYYYNGNYKCFSTDDLEHLSFAVVALILGVMVILFPAVVLLISFKRFKVHIVNSTRIKRQ